MTTVLSPEAAAIVRQHIANDEASDSTHVIYEGKSMTRTEANELITAKQIESRHTFFDPQDLVDDLVNANLKFEVRSSMAWSVDMACINAARDLFYRMRESKADSIDDFNEFINDVAEIKANESYNEDLGFEENSGTLKSLSMLLVLRQHWHDQAETAGKVVGAKYAPKTLEELLASEKPRMLDKDAALNLEVLAKAMTRKNPERFEQTKQLLVKQQANAFERQHESRKLTAPAVANLFAIAEYRSQVAEVAFHELSDMVQLRLITQTKGAVERSLSNLATRRGVNAVAYAQATVEGFDAIDRLDAVIAQRTE